MSEEKSYAFMDRNYTYIESKPGVYTVGFYDPQGNWVGESDHPSEEEAADQVAWLSVPGVTAHLPPGIFLL